MPPVMVVAIVDRQGNNRRSSGLTFPEQGPSVASTHSVQSLSAFVASEAYDASRLKSTDSVDAFERALGQG
jgi:hypothetical protein